MAMWQLDQAKVTDLNKVRKIIETLLRNDLRADNPSIDGGYILKEYLTSPESESLPEKIFFEEDQSKENLWRILSQIRQKIFAITDKKRASLASAGLSTDLQEAYQMTGDYDLETAGTDSSYLAKIAQALYQITELLEETVEKKIERDLNADPITEITLPLKFAWKEFTKFVTAKKEVNTLILESLKQIAEAYLKTQPGERLIEIKGKKYSAYNLNFSVFDYYLTQIKDSLKSDFKDFSPLSIFLNDKIKKEINQYPDVVMGKIGVVVSPVDFEKKTQDNQDLEKFIKLLEDILEYLAKKEKATSKPTDEADSEDEGGESDETTEEKINYLGTEIGDLTQQLITLTSSYIYFEYFSDEIRTTLTDSNQISRDQSFIEQKIKEYLLDEDEDVNINFTEIIEETLNQDQQKEEPLFYETEENDDGNITKKFVRNEAFENWLLAQREVIANEFLNKIDLKSFKEIITQSLLEEFYSPKSEYLPDEQETLEEPSKKTTPQSAIPTNLAGLLTELHNRNQNEIAKDIENIIAVNRSENFYDVWRHLSLRQRRRLLESGNLLRKYSYLDPQAVVAEAKQLLLEDLNNIDLKSLKFLDTGQEINQSNVLEAYQHLLIDYLSDSNFRDQLPQLTTSQDLINYIKSIPAFKQNLESYIQKNLAATFHFQEVVAKEDLVSFYGGNQLAKENIDNTIDSLLVLARDPLESLNYFHDYELLVLFGADKIVKYEDIPAFKEALIEYISLRIEERNFISKFEGLRKDSKLSISDITEVREEIRNYGSAKTLIAVLTADENDIEDLDEEYQSFADQLRREAWDSLTKAEREEFLRKYSTENPDLETSTQDLDSQIPPEYFTVYETILILDPEETLAAPQNYSGRAFERTGVGQFRRNFLNRNKQSSVGEK
jgi:hypothetical protein